MLGCFPPICYDFFKKHFYQLMSFAMLTNHMESKGYSLFIGLPEQFDFSHFPVAKSHSLTFSFLCI